jgi:hypothetical protein
VPAHVDGEARESAARADAIRAPPHPRQRPWEEADGRGCRETSVRDEPPAAGVCRPPSRRPTDSDEETSGGDSVQPTHSS